MFLQVGIITVEHETTFDIRAKIIWVLLLQMTGVLGSRVNSLSVDGSVNGQFVYLIQDNSPFAKGFFYWDGTIWKGVDATNDYWTNDAANARVELYLMGLLPNQQLQSLLLMTTVCGIGTTNPTSKLEINGDLKVNTADKQLTGLT